MACRGRAGLTVSVWMVFVVLMAVFGVVLNAPVVKASGTIYIRADGSIDPPTAPIHTADNVTYAFTADINDSIVVERDNIVVDGAGYTLQGTGSGNGMDLSSRSNVTIKNMEIKTFNYGVCLYGSSSNSIVGNNITNNHDGVYVYESLNNSIVENDITNNNGYGIFLDWFSKYNSIVENNITNDVYGIWFGYSNYNSIVGNNITNNHDGVWLGSSSNSIVGNNITNNHDGVYLYESPNNSIAENNITNNGYGIFLDWSSNYYSIVGNNITNNNGYGIWLGYSNYDSIVGNNITNNNCSIGLYESSGSHIYHNNFIDNTSPGFGGTAEWDNGYPSGGNYWSDYAGADLYSGPYQNETGSDGIGDTPYTYWPDRYPLMNSMGSPQPPIALFAYTPEQPLKDKTVTFDASASGDRDGYIAAYKWNFGDGNITTVTDSIVTHIYTALGTYTVNLTITDNDGLGHSTTKSIIVTEDSTPPTTSHDYDDLWHTADFTITLTVTDDISGVAETYYKINDGPTKTVSSDGQPLITTEGANNTLEYWSLDNAGNEESHHILTGIKLDKTAPTGSVTIAEGANYTDSASVTLTLSANDATSGISQMRFSNDNVTWSDWEAYATPKPWTLLTGDGVKVVVVQYRDNAGLISETSFDAIILDTTAPVMDIPSCDPANNVQPDQPVKVSVNVTDALSKVKNATLYYTVNNGTSWEQPVLMNYSPSTNLYEATIPGQQSGTWVKYKIVAYDQAGNNATLDGTQPYCTYQVVPEFPQAIILPLFIITTLLVVIIRKRKKTPV